MLTLRIIVQAIIKIDPIIREMDDTHDWMLQNKK